MKKFIDVGVLGGGFCGLLIGNELKKRGASFLILERESEAGGLARTVKFENVPGDTGPHALYSPNSKVMAYFRSLPIHYDTHQRKVRVVHHGSDGEIHEVNYPFENGIGNLPLSDRADCLEGYVQAMMKRRTGFKNLRDWIDNGLGYGIGRHFMIPYNQKIWNAPLSRISMDLVNKKIEPAPPRVIIESALGIPTIGRKVQSVFLYPEGGIGAISRHLAAKISPHLRLDCPVLSIKQEGGGYAVRTRQDTFYFKCLISTIPLKQFLALQPFNDFKRHGKALRNNDTLFVSVALREGVRFKRFFDCHWLFFAGPEIFYRINMMHAFHRSQFHHLVAEITWKGRIKSLPLKDVEKCVVEDLISVGILDKAQDVSAISSKKVECTYPIPTTGLRQAKQRLDAALAKRKIYLVGRSGHWDYINMDQVVERVWGFFDGWSKVRAALRR